MIRHSVVFKLKHPANSEKAKEFLNEAMKLVSIPGVKDFECLRQTSKKNKFDFGLFMSFDNNALYEYYNNHEDHVNFVDKHWIPNVEDFIELDFEALEPMK